MVVVVSAQSTRAGAAGYQVAYQGDQAVEGEAYQADVDEGEDDVADAR